MFCFNTLDSIYGKIIFLALHAHGHVVVVVSREHGASQRSQAMIGDFLDNRTNHVPKMDCWAFASSFLDHKRLSWVGPCFCREPLFYSLAFDSDVS